MFDPALNVTPSEELNIYAIGTIGVLEILYMGDRGQSVRSTELNADLPYHRVSP